jgi:hypothetical protein
MNQSDSFKKSVLKALSQMAKRPVEPKEPSAAMLNGVSNHLGNFAADTHPHSLHDYLHRFDAMVARLQAHPEIVVLGYNTFDPMPESKFSEYEAELGFALPEDLKTFYRQTDGLQLRWISRANDSFDEDEHVFGEEPVEWNWSLLDDWPADGVVMIQPLWELLNEYGEGTYYFEDEEEPSWQETYLGEQVAYSVFRRNLRLFDFYANERDMTLYLNPAGPSTLIIGHSSQSSFDMSVFVDIGTYLEFLIARLGRVEDRHEYFFRESGRESVWNYAPKAYWDGNAFNLDAL